MVLVDNQVFWVNFGISNQIKVIFAYFEHTYYWPLYFILLYIMRVSSSILMTSTDFFRFAKDIYCKRFPDLETLIVQPLDYLLTAKELGNNIGNTKNNKTLEAYLSQATIMVVSVTASTTTGAGTLNEKDLETVSKGTRIF